MKLIIFGATGTIGCQLTEQALTRGHQVTAFARRPFALNIKHQNLTHFTGDVMDRAVVAEAVRGNEVVLITLGAGMRGTVRSVGTKHIIDAMEQHNIHRLICQSTLGAGDSHANLNFFWKYIMFGLLLRKAHRDHEAQETFVTQSNLDDWTIVRPAAFTDGPATNDYKHGFPATERNITLKISRADVAGFMLKQLKDDNYLRQTPGLSY